MLTKEDQIILEYLAGKKALMGYGETQKFSYISNPSGTIRWIFPKYLRSSTFLNFYSRSSLRAMIVYNIIKVAFLLRISKLVISGELDLQIQQGSILNQILKNYEFDGYSIFTGTVGENRKAIIEFHSNNQVHTFVKVALTESARILVNNEADRLTELNKFRFNHLVIPELLDTNRIDTIGISNIKPNSFVQNSSIVPIHIKALKELYDCSKKNLSWTRLPSLRDTKLHVFTLIEDPEVCNDLDQRKLQLLVGKIQSLIEILEENDEELIVANSHGDFTPWNMFVTKDKLHLFDWELSEIEMPLMFDIIHYVFQSNVMINQVGFKEIHDSLIAILKNKNVVNMVNDYRVNFNKNYTFYLVYTISYYLKKYAKQSDLHDQAYRLIEVWDDAVSDLLDKRGIAF